MLQLLLFVFCCLCGVCCLSEAQMLTSQPSHVPCYTVYRAAGSIWIDGQLNETSWKQATSTGELWIAAGYAHPALKTEVKMLWDSVYLYLAFHCEDTDIRATKTLRDDKLWEEEAVEVFFTHSLDPERGGYTELEISPMNTVLDLFVRYVKGVMPVALPYHTYNVNILSAVHIQGTLNNSSDKDTSWTVECAIPLRDIAPVNLHPITDGDKWRMNFYRMERFPEREFIAWSPTFLNKFHVPARFGEIIFSAQPVSAQSVGKKE